MTVTQEFGTGLGEQRKQRRYRRKPVDHDNLLSTDIEISNRVKHASWLPCHSSSTSSRTLHKAYGFGQPELSYRPPLWFAADSFLPQSALGAPNKKSEICALVGARNYTMSPAPPCS
eukprot:1184443-Prorocentrum_minimum.AAC.7